MSTRSARSARSDLPEGTTIMPLENDRTYVVRLPAWCNPEDIEETMRTLRAMRSGDPEHAPRFLVCRADVDVFPAEESSP